MVFKKNLFKNIALVVSSILFVLLLCELLLRGISFSYPNYYTHDIHTGAKHRPGAEGWYREEGEAYVKINSAGMRDDREIELEKAVGIFRIAVLGDSYVEALQIPTNDTFLALMEKKLNKCDAFKGRKVEVLNFGVSGYSTAQELLTLKHRVWPYNPDLVLLAFLASNDIRDNSKLISGNTPRPFFTVQNDQLLLDKSFMDSQSYKIKSSKVWEFLQATSDFSRVFQLFNKFKNVYGQRGTSPSQSNSNNTHQLGLDDKIYIPPTEYLWESAWNVTEKLLIGVFNEVRVQHKKFLLVDITNGIDVYPDLDIKRKYMKEIGVQDLDYPHNRIERLAHHEGMPLIGLKHDFNEYAVKHNSYLHGFPKTGLGFGHWNKTAHALAAEIISARICSDARGG